MEITVLPLQPSPPTLDSNLSHLLLQSLPQVHVIPLALSVCFCLLNTFPTYYFSIYLREPFIDHSLPREHKTDHHNISSKPTRTCTRVDCTEESGGTYKYYAAL